MPIADWLLDRLACPHDKSAVRVEGEQLRCGEGHEFPVRDGIPILLRHDAASTHPELETTGEKKDAANRWRHDGNASQQIDEFVQANIVHTCGNLYRPLIGRLSRYPIPELRVVPRDGSGKTFLDIGSNWGRWSIAASRLGYSVVGVDPMLDGLRAARRVATQLESSAEFLAAEGRALPFADESFDVVWSYSVFQHLGKDDVRLALNEIRRVLVPGGLSVVEMPTALGARNIYVRARRKLSRTELRPDDFHVRYWPGDELIETFEQRVGPTRMEVDSFFFINGQPVDRDLLPRRYGIAVWASESLRKASQRLPALTRIADSVYVTSQKAGAS
jgi:SAM-dependent methyltransferase/uncharacterized protein YbaR (Trm112 family)